MKAAQLPTAESPWKRFYSDRRPSLADLMVNQRIEDLDQWYPGRWRKSDLSDEAYEITDFFPHLGEKGKWLRCTAAVLRDGEDELFGSIETLEDITDRRNAEEALKKSEEQLKAILEGSPIPTFVIGTDHTVIYWNRALEEISKVKAEGNQRHKKSLEGILQRGTPLHGRYSRGRTNRGNPPLVCRKLYKIKVDCRGLRRNGFFFRPWEIRGNGFASHRGCAEGFRRNAVGRHGNTGRLLREENSPRKPCEQTKKNNRTLSITDGLTKLFNGRYFYQQLRTEIERSNRYHHPLTLLFLDIDNFKNYNDTYGHLEGDEVLVRLGEVMLQCLRKTDLAFRFGGEEFTAILPETEGEAAVVLAERIRKEFRRERFYPQGDDVVQVTVSIGVAQYTFEEQFSSFLKRADKNMYCAKQEGRDRVVFDQDASDPRSAKGKLTPFRPLISAEIRKETSHCSWRSFSARSSRIASNWRLMSIICRRILKMISTPERLTSRSSTRIFTRRSVSISSGPVAALRCVFGHTGTDDILFFKVG